ncbi:MAG: DSD1 family PLP-dependent enzyme [Alphaproteobacteria bacterium]
MTTPPPARPGMTVDEVDTPALLVDLDAFEANLQRMAREMTGVRIRPHAKTHKCAVIGLQQMALGAVGMCCQKVSEAEALVYGGVSDVLVTNEVVGRHKLQRLAALARRAHIGVCVDDAGNLDDVAAAATEAGVTLDLYVEIDVGAARCGVAPDQAAVALAKQAASKPSLKFMGLQAYHGSAQHLRTPAERKAAIQSASAKSAQAKALIEKAGIPCPIVTGAGTGTYRLEAASGVYNEIQPGSYIFMDADYARNQGEGNRPFDDFRHSLFVLATVMSRSAPDRAVTDAGMKALSIDSGLPTLADGVEAEYVSASDEHGKLQLGASARGIKLGDKLRLIPGHCDPTVNLYDWYVCVRGNRVEVVWPIAARGAVA